MARGEDSSTMRWSSDFFERLTVTAVLRYLAVAHFGRGRGEWSEGEHPAFWQPIVEQAVAGRAAELKRLQKTAARGEAPTHLCGEQFAGVLGLCARQVLERLYPKAPLDLPRQASSTGQTG
jgi:hypothetical protein